MSRDFIFKVKKGEPLPPKDPNGYRLIVDNEKGDVSLMGSDGSLNPLLDNVVYDYLLIEFSDSELFYNESKKIYSIEKNIKLSEKLIGLNSISPVQLIEHPMSEGTRLYGKNFWITYFETRDYYGSPSINVILNSYESTTDIDFTFILQVVGTKS